MTENELFNRITKLGMNVGEFRLIPQNFMGIVCSKKQLLDFAEQLLKDHHGTDRPLS